MNFLNSKCFFSIVLISILATNSPSQAQTHAEATGGQAREHRPIEPHIMKVVMSGSMQLNLKASPIPELYVSGDPKLVAKVTTKIDGDTLYIGTKGIYIAVGKTQQTIVELNLPALEKLQLSGSGNSSVKGFKGTRLEFIAEGSGNYVLESDYSKLQFTASGSGNGQLALPNCQTIALRSQGSGSLILKGKATLLNGVITGSGAFDAMAMQTLKSNLNVAGSGDVSVSVSDDVTAKLTGSGNVYLQGNPTKRHIQHSGSGQLIWK